MNFVRTYNVSSSSNVNISSTRDCDCATSATSTVHDDLMSTVATDTDASQQARDIAIARVTSVVSTCLPAPVGDTAPFWRLWTYGSVALGTTNSSSDVDAILVISNAFPIQDPVELKQQLVSALERCQYISNIDIIDTASVPIISFDFTCEDPAVMVPFDLQIVVNIPLRCASCPSGGLPQSPEDISDADVANLSYANCRSINAVRYAAQFEALLGDRMPTFRSVVSFVKAWAKARGVYSNRMGFLGGLSWAVMVAKACLTCCSNCPGRVAMHFFELYASWNFTDSPIQLVGPDGTDRREWGAAHRSELDAKDVMVVLTPVRPVYNSTKAVSSLALATIRSELRRVALLVPFIRSGKASWCTALAPITLAQAGSGPYLRVDVTSATTTQLRRWQGLVQSRVPSLLRHIADVVPGVKARPHVVKESSQLFIGLTFPATVQDGKGKAASTINFEAAVYPFVTSCQVHPGRAIGDDLNVVVVRRRQLFVSAVKISRRLRHEDPMVSSPTPSVASSMSDSSDHDATLVGAKRDRDHGGADNVGIGKRHRSVASNLLDTVSDVAIDGANLAWAAGHNEMALSAGIVSAMNWPGWQGKTVKVFVPGRYIRNRQAEALLDCNGPMGIAYQLRIGAIRYDSLTGQWVHVVLDQLVRQGRVSVTPPPPADDVMVIDWARRNDAAIVTNDLFRDHIRAENVAIDRQWHACHRVGYTFDECGSFQPMLGAEQHSKPHHGNDRTLPLSTAA